GLLYAPFLTFFNPIDTTMQVAGVVLASVGLGIAAVAGRTLAKHVYARAKDERRLITTGIYAYVRHPLYLAFVLFPLGLVLLTLNYLTLLLALSFWFFTDGDLEACGRRGKLTFLPTAIECEEEGLRRRYGEEYERYASRTGTLVPRLGRPQKR
ncbi:MAG: isoprenylcysteine carboxylmethyltransferase family protein, partial [Euryarchaeota archaeon]|nr:isoprenylcysteine carboxylmethyltransferase family protein [Euryarchaeota archaeon]